MLYCCASSQLPEQPNLEQSDDAKQRAPGECMTPKKAGSITCTGRPQKKTGRTVQILQGVARVGEGLRKDPCPLPQKPSHA